MSRPPVKRLVALCGGVAVCCGQAAAQDDDAAPGADNPVVVEMFLSQACNQSLEAAELVGDLASRRDIVALTWHVDYWDAFAAPGVGAWKDPFARPDFAARQMAYNVRMRGRALKMTPQAVIDGAMSVPGPRRDTVERRIVEARFSEAVARKAPPQLTIDREADGLIRTRIDNIDEPYDAYVVSFRRTTTTNVSGGDNAGVTFHETNVVRGLSPIAKDHIGPGEFSFERPGDGLDCAVIVQERSAGRIVAARYCGEFAALSRE